MARIVLIPPPRKRPPRRFLPYRWKLRVRETIVRLTLWPFLLLAGVLGVGSFAWAAQGWERASTLLDDMGVMEQLRAEPTLLLWAGILSALSLLLLVLIVSRLLDSVLFLSIARNLLFVAAFYLICVLFRQLDPPSAFLGGILLGLTLLAVVTFQVGGPLGEHWVHRAYGDVLLELVIFVPFLYMLWPPLVSTGHVERVVELIGEWGGRVAGLV